MSISTGDVIIMAIVFLLGVCLRIKISSRVRVRVRPTIMGTWVASDESSMVETVGHTRDEALVRLLEESPSFLLLQDKTHLDRDAEISVK
jgi:hypothetical protein